MHLRCWGRRRWLVDARLSDTSDERSQVLSITNPKSIILIHLPCAQIDPPCVLLVSEYSCGVSSIRAQCVFGAIHVIIKSTNKNVIPTPAEYTHTRRETRRGH